MIRDWPNELKKGDIVYECQSGQCVQVQLTSDVRVDGSQWSFDAVLVDNESEIINYFTDQSHPSFMPRLYWERAYA